MLATKSSEGRVDLGDRTRIVDLDLQPQGWGGLLRVAPCVLRDGRVGRIDQHCETNGLGDQLLQQPQPLCYHFLREEIDTGRIAARMSQASHKTEPRGLI